MFWDKEKILSVYFKPQPSIYDRLPIDADKKELGYDRETGKIVTLWNEKMRYPYKLSKGTKLCVTTTFRAFEIDIPKGFCWNGANIPKALWTTLGISKDSPIIRRASLGHDYILCEKTKCLNEANKNIPEHLKLDFKAYRRLSSLIFRELLKNDGCKTVKANFMSGAVAGWQFISPQWWGL